MATTVRLTVEVEAILAQTLEKQAAKAGLTLSDVVNALLRHGLSETSRTAACANPLDMVIQGLFQAQRSAAPATRMKKP